MSSTTLNVCEEVEVCMRCGKKMKQFGVVQARCRIYHLCPKCFVDVSKRIEEIVYEEWEKKVQERRSREKV